MKRDGFTLVELIAVVVIISILAAVAIPKFASAQNKAKASEFPMMFSQIVAAQETNIAELDEVFEAGDGTLAGNVQFESACGVDISDNSYFGYQSGSDAGTDPNPFYVQGVLRKVNLGKVIIGSWAVVESSGNKYGDPDTGEESLRSLAKNYFH